MRDFTVQALKYKTDLKSVSAGNSAGRGNDCDILFSI